MKLAFAKLNANTDGFRGYVGSLAKSYRSANEECDAT